MFVMKCRFVPNARAVMAPDLRDRVERRVIVRACVKDRVVEENGVSVW